MLAQLEVKEINSRTSKDFPVLEFFFPIRGLSRIFKARGQGVQARESGWFMLCPRAAKRTKNCDDINLQSKFKTGNSPCKARRLWHY